MSALGVSIREFARRSGCDEKQVRRGIASGKLKVQEDGSLDPDLVGSGWRRPTKATRANADKNKTSANLSASLLCDEAPAVVAARIVTQAAALLPLSEAIQMKENYNALLKQLEYDKESGLVVMADAVLKEVGEEYAKVRTRILAIPSEQAPRIHRLKTVTEVQDALHELLSEALEELTKDEI